MEELVGDKECRLVELDEEGGALTATINKKGPAIEMLKAKPVADYPVEEGCFLRGNDYSPVAVVVLLNAPYGTLPPAMQSTPPQIEKLVRVGIETGAAVAGTLQTENIGIEKIVCNVVGNSNIRYLVLCGAEVAGHQSGSALKALLKNGINEKRTIIGSQAVTPYLFNIPLEAIERFRGQVTLVDLVGEMDPEVIGKAVWSCYQEEPTPFKGYMLYDPGAYCHFGLSARLTGKVEHPEQIEEWELDDVLRRIEAPREEARIQQVTTQPEQLEALAEAKIHSFLRRQLLRLSEELADLAGLLAEQSEAPSAPAVRVQERQPAVAPAPQRGAVVRERPVRVEEDPTVLYFDTQLRGFHSALAGLEACDEDICKDGCSLPLAVTSTIKRLERLRGGLQQATLPPEDRDRLVARLDASLKRAEALPQEGGT